MIRPNRPVRAARIGAAALLALCVTTGLASCTQTVQDDPTALRRDYRSLEQLLAIARGAVVELHRAIDIRAWDVAGAYVINVKAYLAKIPEMHADLAHRDFVDVEAFDRETTVAVAHLDVCDYYTRLHKAAQGMRTAVIVLQALDGLNSYLGPASPIDGDVHHPRPVIYE